MLRGLRGKSVESTWTGQRDVNGYERKYMCYYVGIAYGLWHAKQTRPPVSYHRIQSNISVM